MNATGTALVYAGYIGGAGSELGRDIAVDNNGNAYVTGDTESNQTSFPVKVGPDKTHNGNTDAFVAKVNSTGSALVYAGYIGGSERDVGQGIAVDSTGNAYVAGETFSNQASFPVKMGPDLTYNGMGDAFVAKVNTGGNMLLYAGYIGSTLFDGAYGIAIDRQGHGNAFVTGSTGGDQTTFPVKVGPDLTYNGNGWSDAFVAKVRVQ